MKAPPTPLLATAEPSAPAACGLPVLRLGFRPFYLGAALLACLAVPVWVAVFLGRFALEPALPALLWHAHEMLFGFAAAVIIGFLFTAARAWTGLQTPRGAFLAALAVLWLAARVASVSGPHALHALLDVLLLPLVAAILMDVLLRAGKRRNLILVLILALLALANLAFHLSVIGAIAVAPATPLYAALGLIVMIECVMAGRVIPAFTQSATPGLQIGPAPRLDALALAFTAAGLSLWVFAAPGALTGGALALAAGLHLRRQWRWRPLVSRSRPILWILHAAYAWIPLGLALLALAAGGWIPASAGVHALAVGATGGLVIGMITRTARGHTGRALRACGPEVLAYALVMSAAALRVSSSLLPGELLPALLVGAALAWSAAFAIYLWIYTPWLLRARADGKDG